MSEHLQCGFQKRRRERIEYVIRRTVESNYRTRGKPIVFFHFMFEYNRHRDMIIKKQYDQSLIKIVFPILL